MKCSRFLCSWSNKTFRCTLKKGPERKANGHNIPIYVKKGFEKESKWPCSKANIVVKRLLLHTFAIFLFKSFDSIPKYSRTRILKISSFPFPKATKKTWKTDIVYSRVSNNGGTTIIYFERKIGQKWPKSCNFM